MEVYDSWYDLPQNPYKKDTETVRREAAGSDLVIGDLNQFVNSCYDERFQSCAMT